VAFVAAKLSRKLSVDALDAIHVSRRLSELPKGLIAAAREHHRRRLRNELGNAREGGLVVDVDVQMKRLRNVLLDRLSIQDGRFQFVDRIIDVGIPLTRFDPGARPLDYRWTK
jgi:hypothetical protein